MWPATYRNFSKWTVCKIDCEPLALQMYICRNHIQCSFDKCVGWRAMYEVRLPIDRIFLKIVPASNVKTTRVRGVGGTKDCI